MEEGRNCLDFVKQVLGGLDARHSNFETVLRPMAHTACTLKNLPATQHVGAFIRRAAMDMVFNVILRVSNTKSDLYTAVIK